MQLASLHNAVRGEADSRWRRVLRLGVVQLLGALVLCVLLPALLRHPFVPAREATTFVNTTLGSALATTIGFYFSRRIGLFPGIQSGAYIIFCLSGAYLALAFLLLFNRLEYSRFILIASYGLSTAWFFILHYLLTKRSQLRLLVVPGGKVDALRAVDDVEWLLLRAPPDKGSVGAPVVADLRYDLSEEWERFIAQCALAGTPVYHMKQVMESLTGKVEIEHLSENTFGSLLPNAIYLNVKSAVDRLVALALLPVLGLIALVLAPFIMRSTRGSVFFVQDRVGYRGELFRIYKFRTMVTAQADASQRDHAMTRDGDARVTALGRVLRKYRIDELPQLLNILKGEMSWIGPRPEAVSLSEWYSLELPYYSYRHVVRPGITGWAQVNQGHVTSAEEVLEKLHFDFFYIKHLSPWLDFLIVFRTIRTVLFGFGAR